ncbi:ferritin [Marinactinospora thermotolerans]|uniref:Ferritin n=1 Tax=Marinactinospora thermotolerans DSM 45154 TaxID=1122192 RepID=A0A1T4KTD3_9ACTN|nr:ferritin [Marinactinospora thermotolerans]SJZ45692.1 Ferritin [Marinactinospora thermotolerans DSM 45154]
MTSTTIGSERGLSKFHRLLLDQLRHEFTASQQYIALATWFDERDLPQLARVFYRQSLEERDHAMMIVRFLIDNDVPVTIPATGEVRNEFDTARDLVALALRQEREVTEQFHLLTKAARDENDYTGEQFLHWFLKEQTEEVAKMSTLLAVIDRSNGNLFDVETFVARDMPDETGGDATAPGTAGPSLTL